MVNLDKRSGKIRKIAILEPAGTPAGNFFGGFRLPRYGVVLLGTILAQRGYKVDVHSEELAPLDWSDIMSADLVGISNITPTALRGYAMADAIREAGIPVVSGGYHDTFLPDEALDHADFVVKGEAENTLLELLEAIQNGGDFSPIAGLSFKVDGQKIHNPPRAMESELDRFPIPDFSLVRGMRLNATVSIITRRGCPFDCSFCCATAFNGRKVREHSVDRVLSEIEKQMYWIGKRGLLFFLDDIFNLKPERMKAILRGMIAKRMTPLWVAQVRHEAAHDRELLELMRQSNCIRVFVGLESVNPRTLERFGKCQTVEDISGAIQAFHEVGIKVHGLFVLGSDDDTLETAEQTLKFCQAHDLDSIQISTLTPLPGSRDFREMTKTPGKLLPVPWTFYDCYHVVHVPERISPVDLQIAGKRTMVKFYSLKGIGQRLLRGDLSEAIVRLHCYRLLRGPLEIGPYTRWLKNPSGTPPEPTGSVAVNTQELLAYASGGKGRSSWLKRLRYWLATHLGISLTRFLHLPSGWSSKRTLRADRSRDYAADSAANGVEDSGR